MDSLSHMTQKLLAERARNASQQRQQNPEDINAPPPPYSESENDSDADEDDDEEEPESPMKLTINATNSIQGSHNLVPTSPTPLSDATKFSTLLLHAVKQLNAAAEANKSLGSLKVDLTINCGITVIGDRNVVGNVGLKPKAPGAGGAAPAPAIAGAKRKADDEPVEPESAVKKVATDAPIKEE